VTREPRPAARSFAAAGLPERLVTALARRGMETPFAIQAAALPDALAGEHVLGRAQTGAGKTLGFGLPVLTRLAAARDVTPPAPMRPRGLVLVPTRELALQVSEALTPLGAPLGVRTSVAVGGMSIMRQVQSLAGRVDLLIATPGRLVDLLERGAVSLDEIEVTVLDEADHLCDLGFFPVMRRLLAMTPAGGQRLLFSATLDGDVAKLVTEFLPEPVLVAVDPEVQSISTMEHHAWEVRDTTERLALLRTLVSGEGRALVFSRTKHGADRLAKQISSDGGAHALALHGGMQQNARTRALAAFTAGSTRVLVATDVAARGIHVDDVRLVIHADIADESKTFTHRSGRTARAGADGTVVQLSFPAQRDAASSILRAAGVEATLRRLDSDDPLVRAVAGPVATTPLAPAPRPLSVEGEGPRGGRPPRASSAGAPTSARRRGFDRPRSAAHRTTSSTGAASPGAASPATTSPATTSPATTSTGAKSPGAASVDRTAGAPAPAAARDESWGGAAARAAAVGGRPSAGEATQRAASQRRDGHRADGARSEGQRPPSQGARGPARPPRRSARPAGRPTAG